MDIKTEFPLRLVISLARREDRRARLFPRLAAAGIGAEWWPAIDGQRLESARGFAGIPHRANSLTFRAALRRAEQRAASAVLVIEDDCVLSADFAARVVSLVLPADWDIFYFGCLHITPPVPVRPGVVRVTRAYDFHCVAFRASIYRRLRAAIARANGHSNATDTLAADLHSQVRAYAAWPNLAWQEHGDSDIARRRYSNYDANGRQVFCADAVKHL